MQLHAPSLEVFDDFQGVESRAKQAIELGRDHDVTGLELGEQLAAGGTIFDRDRAANAFLDDHLGHREAVHHGIAFDLALLHIEAFAFVGLARR